jgi:hypothetical protein
MGKRHDDQGNGARGDAGQGSAPFPPTDHDKEETMPDLSTIFAYAVAVFAGLAVLAVLAFVIVWAVLGIRRELARDRAVSRFDPSTRYWRERSAMTIPERES